MKRKKKTGKRVLTILFTVIMAGVLLAGVPTEMSQVQAETTVVDSGICGENVYYTLDSDGTLTIYGTGEMADYDVDDEDDDCPFGGKEIKKVIIQEGVTTIGDYAFSSCFDYVDGAIEGTIESVTIADSVTSIGNWAFANCSGIASIVFPKNISSIGDGAFRNCTELKQITIPEGLISIGDETFMWCSNLENIELPDSLTSIGEGAFYDCTNLQNIKLPNNDTKIGDYAFFGCERLTRIEIPDNLNSIEGAVIFGNCYSLQEFVVAETHEKYSTYDGVLYNKDKTSLLCCPHAKQNVEILNGVTRIGDNAFYLCMNLTSINLPDSLTVIGSMAFAECWSLESLDIPENVTYIGTAAFGNCCGLTSINLNCKVTSIELQTFFGCESLTSIELPDTVTSIAELAIDCENLQSIKIPASVTSIDDDALGYGTPKTCKILCYKDSAAEAFAKKMGYAYKLLEPDSAGQGNNTDNNTQQPNNDKQDSQQTDGTDNETTNTEPQLPGVGTQKTISTGTYKVTTSSAKGKEVSFMKPASSKKTSLTIPATVKIDGYTYKVTEIAPKAFKNNKKLKSVTFGKNVKKIGKEAFSGCKNLNKITIKSTVLKSVGKNAIKGIDSKATIKVPKKQLAKYKKLFKSKTGFKKSMKVKK